MKRLILLIILIYPIMGMAMGCVAKDPAHPVVIKEVQDGLREKFSGDLAQVRKMSIFENTLKVFMVDEYSPDNLENFANATTKLFGERMRANKKLSQMYYVNFFQKKMVDNKKELKQSAECTFDNGSDRIKVKILGLGSGKYDVK